MPAIDFSKASEGTPVKVTERPTAKGKRADDFTEAEEAFAQRLLDNPQQSFPLTLPGEGKALTASIGNVSKRLNDLVKRQTKDDAQPMRVSYSRESQGSATIYLNVVKIETAEVVEAPTPSKATGASKAA